MFDKFSNRELRYLDKLKSEKDWDIIEQAINEEILIGFKFTDKNSIFIIRDKIENIDWEVYSKGRPKTIEEYRNFKPGRYSPFYKEKYGLTPEEYFIKYYLKRRNDWEIIEKLLSINKIKISIANKSGRTPPCLSICDKYGRYWNLRESRYPKTLEEWLNYEPQAWNDSYLKKYGLSKREFIIDYSLKKLEKWEIIEKAIELGVVVPEPPYKGAILIKDSVHGILFPISIKLLPKTLEEYLNWKPFRWDKSYENIGLTREEFFIKFILMVREDWSIIKEALDKGFARIFLNHIYYLQIKGLDSNWITLYDTNSYPKSIEEYMNYSRKSCFIEPYNESLINIENSDKQFCILDNPIKLTLENIDSVIGKAITWDLFNEISGESIYVGESSNGGQELETLILYIIKDKKRTIERRKRMFGFSGEQKRIEEIFKYDFSVRLLATDVVGRSKYVRAFESVWNQDCNNGKGCLIKQ